MNEFAQLRQKAGLSIAQAAKTTGYSASTVYRWDRGEKPPRRAAIDTMRRVIADRVAAEPAEPGFTFVDLFAGPGRCRVRPAGDFVDGSPLMAQSKGFTHAFHVDLSAQCVDALRQRLAKVPGPKAPCDCAISFSWCGKTRSFPPPCRSKLSPR